MSEVKTKLISARVSQEEYDLIVEKASMNNMPLSKYIRERILFDIPQIEHQSFEFKALKGISYCAGILATAINLKLTPQEKETAEQEAIRIMITNGLDEKLIRTKISQS